jgi:hypothetical protein
MKYGRFTRILHTLIATGILLELLSSLEKSKGSGSDYDKSRLAPFTLPILRA